MWPCYFLSIMPTKNQKLISELIFTLILEVEGEFICVVTSKYSGAGTGSRAQMYLKSGFTFYFFLCVSSVPSNSSSY